MVAVRLTCANPCITKTCRRPSKIPPSRNVSLAIGCPTFLTAYPPLNVSDQGVAVVGLSCSGMLFLSSRLVEAADICSSIVNSRRIGTLQECKQEQELTLLPLQACAGEEVGKTLPTNATGTPVAIPAWSLSMAASTRQTWPTNLTAWPRRMLP